MPGRSHFYGWSLVGVLWVIYFINGPFCMVGGSVMSAYMVRDLMISRSTLGLGFTMFSLFMGLPAGLIALCINKKGIRLALFLGSFILVAGALLMGSFVTEGWQFVIVFGIILGTGTGFGSVMPVQTGVTLWFVKKRALAMSVVLTAGGLGGFAIAPLLNMIIPLANGNWRYGWLFIAVMCVLAGFISLFFVKNKPSDLGQVPDGFEEVEKKDEAAEGKSKPNAGKTYQTKRDWTVSQVLKTPTIWLIVIGGIGFIIPWMTCLAHGVLHLKDQGLPADKAALSIGFMLFSSIAGRLAGGFLGDRTEPRYICAIGLVLQMAGCIFLVEASHMGMVYLFALCMGMGFGATFVCLPTMSGNYFGASVFASLQGVLYPINIVFGAAAPYLAGLGYDALGNYRLALYTSAVFAGIGGLLLFLARPPKV